MTSFSFWTLLGILEDPLYKWIVAVFGSLIVLNVITFLIGLSRLTLLEASESQWWGSITSIALYDSWESIEIMAVLPVFWLLTNRRIDTHERRKRSLFFLLTSIFGAILANYIWSIRPVDLGIQSYGVSGVGMVADGIILVFSIMNAASLYVASNSPMDPLARTESENATLRNLQLAVCLLACSATVIIPVVVVSAIDENVNSFVHVVSLIIGMVASCIYESAVLIFSLRTSQGLRKFNFRLR